VTTLWRPARRGEIAGRIDVVKRAARIDIDFPAPRAGSRIWRQIAASVRFAIDVGRLRPGARLPSTRVLAGRLGVSRNTVAFAYDDLAGDGYIRARAGDGSYVDEAHQRRHPPLHARRFHVLSDPDGTRLTLIP
jgi:DNA-binding transcriptional regulator YhcF (GntR family)